MKTLPHPSLAAAVALVALLALTGCAAASGASPAPFGSADAADDREVVGTGTVIEDAGEARLCVIVAESYPPQCGSGVELEDWSWDGLEGSETASGVTWGAYAVQGTYDGGSLTVTQTPVLLALYDAAPLPPSEETTGETDEATLLRIQEELFTELGDRAVSSAPSDGALSLTVIWDDGSLQQELDARYGPDVVLVDSALRPVAE